MQTLQSLQTMQKPHPFVGMGSNAGRKLCLDFTVMPGLQLFQSLAGGIVEYIIHGTGRKLKLLAGFNGLLAGKFCFSLSVLIFSPN